MTLTVIERDSYEMNKKPQTMNVCAFATQNNTLNGTLCVCARFFTVSSQLISTMFCGSFFCCCIFVSKWIASIPFLFFCWTNASDDLAVHKVKRKKNATTLFAFKFSDVSLFSMLRFDLFCKCVFFRCCCLVYLIPRTMHQCNRIKDETTITLIILNKFVLCA